MSSTYRILCLSHDPAILLDEGQEFHSGSGGRERAEAAVLDGIKGHEGCDLAIGRYSYPLVEVGCPNRANHPGGFHPHGTQWTDAEWLALLLVSSSANPDPQMKKAVARAQRNVGCWTFERLNRLRFELDTEDAS